MHWTGHHHIDGELLDEPFLSQDGVVALVRKKNATSQTMVVLSDASFDDFDDDERPEVFE
jgi:hypothetical protein